MTEAWTKWESQIVNGTFPLRRFLGGSDHSAVFLTEHKAHQLPNAAIKLIPADPAFAEAQLSRWRTAATLSHPHLIRLLDAGRCQLGGHQFLYVVTEYGEETLSQILPLRALSTDEVREMLAPTLEALAFLHGRNMVQGQLKPPNFLVVNDQLKLASDSIRRIGEPAGGIAKSSLYDPPEAKTGKTSPAGDVWALGVTLVEALTQCPPAWPDAKSETPSLPTTLPASFADIVRRCLSRSPENRPTVPDLMAQFRQPSSPPAASPQAAVAAPARRAAAPRTAAPAAESGPAAKSARRLIVPAVVAILILVAIWAGSRLLQSHPQDEQTPATSSHAAPAKESPAQSASQTPEVPPASSAAPAAAGGEKPEESKPAPSTPARSTSAAKTPTQPSTQEVVHEEIPDVPRSARNTIHGHIKVSVRVTVDSSGNVIDQSLENPGPSKYFARLATESSMKWKFAPADGQDSRAWLLHFEFARGGTTAHAAKPRS